MSTRYYKNKKDSVSGNTGTESDNIPDDFDIPSCTVEDVDRALFDVMDKQLPFTYKHKSGTKKAPVIFASGERFAVLRRKEPLRDKSGALILPLVSIMRTGISQVPTMGAATAQNGTHTIKKRVSKEDPVYQRILNKKGFKNSDDLPSNASFANAAQEPEKNAAPGRLATRRSATKRSGKSLLDPDLSKNIYEIIEIPAPKYYTATYEITFWTQYTQQMNDMITAMMSVYQSFSQRTFQLETSKGYWFVAYVGEELSPGNNFDDFTDSERLVRCSFSVTVPAYIINPKFPGHQKTLRRYYSAPEISFDAVVTTKQFEVKENQGPISGDPSSHVLEDLRTEGEMPAGQNIGNTKSASSDSRGIFKRRQGAKASQQSSGDTNIGGSTRDDGRTKIIEYDRDPFTGKSTKKELHLKTRSNRQGETVLREPLE